MMRIMLQDYKGPRIADILSRGSPASREELEQLFTRHIAEVKPHILAYIKDNEIQRLLVLELYRANVMVRQKEKGDVMNRLARVVGCNRRTVLKWVTAQFNGNG